MDALPAWPHPPQSDYDWRYDANCLSSDPELFFPIGTGDLRLEQEKAAKRICAACDVAEYCLRYALETNEDWGVWGNTSEDQRRAMKRRRFSRGR